MNEVVTHIIKDSFKFKNRYSSYFFVFMHPYNLLQQS